MYSFIQEVNDYILKNGIPFKKIIISSKYFPKYFNLAVLYELRKATGKNFVDKYIEEYELMFDDNKLQLVVRSKNNHTVLVIFDKDLWFKYDEPSKKIFETNIVSFAKYLENKEFDEIRKYIDSKGLSGRYTLTQNDFEDSLKESAKMCIEYISYLNELYLTDLEIKAREEKNEKIVSLYYTTPEASFVNARGSSTGGNVSRERVNSILPVDDRIKVLESYDYMYVGYAFSDDVVEDTKNGKEIEYLNYLYNLGNNKYALVMEPYGGISYTKIMIFESLEEITREKFSKIVKDTLELTSAEISASDNIIRTNHTSMETFASLIDYVVRDSNTSTLSNGYTRNKILNLKK